MHAHRSDEQPKTGGTLRSLAGWLGLDRAVVYAVSARIWQLLTGPVTQLFIIFYFTIVQQGYYYAFLNLLAMQIFAELGLHVVLINLSSHEWAGLELRDGRIAGSDVRRDRLVTLGRHAMIWYAVAALVFVTGVACFGYWFFDDTESIRTAVAKASESSAPANVNWVAPWFGLVVLNGLQLAVLPLSAILEGCGQLPVINRIRFAQGIAGTIVVWILITSGFGLWALCGSAAVRLTGEIYLTCVRYRTFFEPFLRRPKVASLSWQREVLPLQWRMAIQGTLLWAATHLAGIVIFRYHGEAEAGRMGMMWTILTALQAASLAWVETRRPLFGTLIAGRDFRTLDQQFFRFSRISIGLMIIGGVLFCAGIWIVEAFSNPLFSRIADRLPNLNTVMLFVLAFALMHLALCTNIYVRAHNRDPFLIAAIIANGAIASLVYWLGRRHGINGVALGYLAGVGLVQVPLWVTIWHVTRQRWHAEQNHA